MTFARAVILALASSLALVGCQTAKQPDTPSGRAEVEIRAPVASVKAALLSRAMDRRFNITKDTEYLLQVEKPTENLAAAVLLGSRYDATPSERIVFTFAPIGENTRVVASLMIVTNPGSAFERLTPINAGEGVDRTQATLDEIKASVEARGPPQGRATSRQASSSLRQDCSAITQTSARLACLRQQ